MAINKRGPDAPSSADSLLNCHHCPGAAQFQSNWQRSGCPFSTPTFRHFSRSRMCRVVAKIICPIFLFFFVYATVIRWTQREGQSPRFVRKLITRDAETKKVKWWPRVSLGIPIRRGTAGRYTYRTAPSGKSPLRMPLTFRGELTRLLGVSELLTTCAPLQICYRLSRRPN